MSLKKCRYCGTTTNLRTDSKNRVYQECYLCIRKNEKEKKEILNNHLKGLNYSISCKEDLINFFVINGYNLSNIKGRFLRSLFVFIQEHNNDKKFNIIKNIEELLEGSHLNKKSSTLEIIYCLANNIFERPKDMFGVLKNFNIKEFRYVEYLQKNQKELEKYNKKQQNINIGYEFTREELKLELLNNKFVEYKEDLLYVSSKLYAHFYQSPLYEKYRYSLWKETKFLDASSTVNERIYCLFHEITEINCCKNSNCNNPTHFGGSTTGYLSYCSCSCSNSDEELLKKREKRFLIKHGYRNSFEMLHKEKLIDWEASQRKRLDTISNWSDERKEEFYKKMSKALSSIPKERRKLINKKIIDTKKKNGTLCGFRGGGFDIKAQELFQYLDKNLHVYKCYYATMFTQNSTVSRNDEYYVPVWEVSENNQIRKLDFYVELKNNIKINIEYDGKYHKNKLQPDLIRENEILQVLSNVYILRVKEDHFLKDKCKVKKELLDIILGIENDKIKDYSDINNAYLPIHITNNSEEIICESYNL